MAERQVRGGWEYEKVPGGWRKVGPAAGGPPANPEFPYKGPKARAEVVGANLDNQFDQATFDARRREAIAKAKQAETLAAANARKFQTRQNPDVPPPQRDAALKAWSAADKMEMMLPELRQRFEEGPGATKGLAGIKDYFPTPANEAFDTAANRFRAPLKSVLGFQGGDTNAAIEAAVNVGPYIPNSGSLNPLSPSAGFDKTARDTMKTLEREAYLGRKRAVTQLRGLPDSSGNVTPLPTGYRFGEHPELDKAIWTHIDRIKPDKRQGFILETKRRFEAAQAKRANSATTTDDDEALINKWLRK
jgi:hypothetical protein